MRLRTTLVSVALGSFAGFGSAQSPEDAQAITQFRELAKYQIASLKGEQAMAVALGDVTGDGYPDLVVANGAGQNRLFHNVCRGRFAEVTATHMPADRDETWSVALGDLDGDGDLDMVLGNVSTATGSAPNRIYVNDGSGKFTDVTATGFPADNLSDGRSTSHVALADVDRDGDLDILFSNAPPISPARIPLRRLHKLYLNQGNAVFTDGSQRLPQEMGTGSCAAFGDLDGDGDLDFVSGTSVGIKPELYLNDGKGYFSAGMPLPAGTAWNRGIALTDVNSDGLLDVAIANFDGGNELLLNAGKGRFADVTEAAAPSPRLPRDNDRSCAIVAGDLDLDGMPDLVIGNELRDNVYMNSQKGVYYVDSRRRIPPLAAPTIALALGDIDGDGDLDLVAGYSGVRLYLNLHRQIHTPYAAVEGHAHEMHFYATPGYGSSIQLALPLVGLRELSSPVPVSGFGTLCIDPASMVALHAVIIPVDTGRATIRVNIPAMARVQGLSEILTQALVFHGPTPGAWRFSNLARDVVQPVPVK